VNKQMKVDLVSVELTHMLGREFNFSY